MAVYAPVAALIVLAFIAGMAGLALFYDARRFLLLIFPLTFAYESANLIMAVVLAAAVSFMAGMLQGGRLEVRVPYPVLFLLVWVSVFYGWSQAGDKDLARYVVQHNYLMPMMVFIFIYNLKPDINLIRGNLTAVSFVAAIVGALTLAMYLRTGVPRIVFQWGSQNQGAAFLGVALSYPILALLGAKTRIGRLFWLGIVCAIGAGILVTQTRAILLACILGMIYVGWHERRVIKVMAPMLLAAAVMAPALFLTRFVMLVGMGPHADWSSVGRVQIWLNSLKLLPQYIFIGMGINNFGGIYKATYPFSFLKAVHPHNLLLFFIFEIGVVGMIAYLALVVSCLLQGHRAVQKSGLSLEDETTRVLVALNAGVLILLIAGVADAYLRDPRTAVVIWSYMAFQLTLAGRLKLNHAGD